MNFLHLTTFYPPYSFGGDAMYLYRLSHALADAGHHVDVIHCVDAYHLQHPAEPEISFAEHPDVKRHELRSRYKWLSPLLTQQTGRSFLKRDQIAAVLNSRPYDVIHYHNISLLGPEILTLKPQNEQFVKLYTTHEHWLVCPTHVLWKYNQRPCEKPACLPCTLHARRPPQLWRYGQYLDKAAAQVDQFVSPSRFTAQMHAQRGFSQPVAHLPYFIERADEDWQEPAARPQERPYFLFVGRLERIKGLHELLRLWERIECYDLIVVGNGTQAEELRAQAAHNQRVKFLGALPQKELGNLYCHAIATIVPSITYETFGIIIIESFARQTPVIVRDLGALPEVVADSEGGHTFKSDAELLAAIEKLGSSPGYRQRLGQNGYRAFLKYWTLAAHMDLYFDFINRNAQRKFGSAAAL